MTTETRLPSFESIYKKYNKSIYRFIRSKIKDKMEAEDLTSEVMIKVHKSLHQFNSELSQMNTWIFNIAKNQLIDFFRKKKLSLVSLESVYVEWMNGEDVPQTDHLIQLADTTSNPEEKMIQQEIFDVVVNKIEAMDNEIEKKIVTLRFIKGLSYDEVAEQLRMPLGTVKAKLHRARMILMNTFPAEMRTAQ